MRLEYDEDNMPESIREHADAVMADPDWTRTVVVAAHVALSLMMDADMRERLGLAQRCELYDDASLVLGAAVSGPKDEPPDDEVNTVVGDALLQVLREVAIRQDAGQGGQG